MGMLGSTVWDEGWFCSFKLCSPAKETDLVDITTIAAWCLLVEKTT